MTELQRRRIRSLAEKLLVTQRVLAAPVDVVKIAESHGITVTRTPADDSLSGFLYCEPKSGDTVIGVNESHHKNRQRFTIAHELGHYLLHARSGIHVDERNSGPHILLRDGASNKEEVEANVFASELLMPEFLLREDLEGCESLDMLDEDLVDELVVELAQKYEVSRQALLIRLGRLGYASL